MVSHIAEKRRATHRFISLVKIRKLSQKDVHQYAQVVRVKVLRETLGGEEDVDELENQQLDTEIFRGVL